MKKLKLNLNELNVESFVLTAKIDKNPKATLVTETAGNTCHIITCGPTCGVEC